MDGVRAHFQKKQKNSRFSGLKRHYEGVHSEPDYYQKMYETSQVTSRSPSTNPYQLPSTLNDRNKTEGEKMWLFPKSNFSTSRPQEPTYQVQESSSMYTQVFKLGSL